MLRNYWRKQLPASGCARSTSRNALAGRLSVSVLHIRVGVLVQKGPNLLVPGLERGLVQQGEAAGWGEVDVQRDILLEQAVHLGPLEGRCGIQHMMFQVLSIPALSLQPRQGGRPTRAAFRGRRKRRRGYGGSSRRWPRGCHRRGRGGGSVAADGRALMWRLRWSASGRTSKTVGTKALK